MGKRTLEIGQLVKWFESYADGLMTKDAGYGVVLGINTYDLGFKDGPYVNYTVYRTKHNDKMKFEYHQLEPTERRA